MIHRNDRQERRGGGTAILVRKTISHSQLPEHDNHHLESTGIRLPTPAGDINIHSIYIPPGDDLPQEELLNLLSEATPTIAAGDFNAKHPEWNSRLTSSRGSKLKRLPDHEDFIIIGPAEETHIDAATDTTDVLDICIHKTLTHRWNMEVKTELYSDHLPILLTIYQPRYEEQQPVEVINWSALENNVHLNNTEITTNTGIEEAAIDMENQITAAIHLATTTKAGSR